MTGQYILVGKVAVPEPDFHRWARWMEFGRQGGVDPRRVAEEDIGGMAWVSTMFLGLDHSFGDGPHPILFETMIFDRSDGTLADLNYQTRCETWAEAERMHEVAVAFATAIVAKAMAMAAVGLTQAAMPK